MKLCAKEKPASPEGQPAVVIVKKSYFGGC
jgi:hypothetical protein